MVFWIGILVGALFAWLAVRLRFYATWVLLFNVLVSTYVAVFLAPAVAEFAPVAGSAASYSLTLSLLVLAGGCFAILHGLSYVFFTGQFNIPFPRMFDILLSGLLGFVVGFLVLSFVALVFNTTPLAQQEIVDNLGFSATSQQANITCLARSCNVIHAIAGHGGAKNSPLVAIGRLVDAGRKIESKHDEPKVDANQPPPPPRKTPRPESGKRRQIVEPP